MLAKEVRDTIPDLVTIELTEAFQRHGYNHSYHEGYAVMLEEYDEATEEVERVSAAFARLWEGVRGNADPGEMKMLALDCEGFALNAIGEMVQFAAMAKKMRVLCDEMQEFAEEAEGTC